MRSAYQAVTARPLSDFVEMMWLAEDYAQPHSSERLLPTGRMNLVLSLGERGPVGNLVGGAQSRYAILDTSRPLSLLGVVFKPGGGFPFFGLPAGELQDSNVPLEALWGREASFLSEQLFAAASSPAKFQVVESYLRSRLRHAPVRDAAVEYAIDTFKHPTRSPSVAAVVERIGLSPRRFIAAFRGEVGLTPKVFCRIARFRRVIGALQRAEHLDWATVALDCGYYDQAHFIHDFRQFAGVSPTAYLRDRTSVNHVRVID
jgi:AraC-like DNA-binding protein